ncbi:MAG: hypothetical protein ACLQVY_15835 [Limisphaerales bacterium]
MRRLVRWSLRILLGFIVVAVGLVVAAILLRDSLLRELFVRRLHAATGMEARVKAVHIGMRSRTLTILGLQLYNTPDFGGGLCLDLPELRIEYDPAALREGSFHLPRVDLDLAGLTFVMNKNGQNNFEVLKKKEKENEAVTHGSAAKGFKFNGIDTLELSLGKFRLKNLATGHEQVIDFDIKKQIFHNVRSEADLNGLGLILALRGGSSSGNSGFDMTALLQTLTAK